MELVALVIVLALLQYFFFGLLVGRARTQYKVEAPATSGHPIFERTFRVQQNTLEQLINLIPCMWIFGAYLHPPTAAALGLVFIAGRFVYLRGYVADPTKRSTGFAIGALAQIALLLGSLFGAVRAVLLA
jgi:uncharacterized membrane protein YecN with MAPEG domain